MGIIWWGTRTEVARRGLVADLCPSCRSVTSFIVFDYFKVFHLYEMALGEPRFIESGRHCVKCQKLFEFDENAYSDVLSPAEVSAITMEEGIRRTNRRLGALVKLVDRLRGLKGGPAYRSPSVEESLGQLDEAIQWLERLIYRGANVSEIAESLDRWERMTEAEREQALDALRRLAKTHGVN